MAAKAVAKKAPSSTVVVKQDVRSANTIERNRTRETSKRRVEAENIREVNRGIRRQERNTDLSERSVANAQQIARVTAAGRQRRAQARTETSGAQGRQAVYSAAGKATSPGSSPILLILATMFGLIVFYTLVTNPQPTSRFAASLGDWLSLISTSTPIFQKKVTTT